MLIDEDFDAEDEWRNGLSCVAKLLQEYSIDVHPYNVSSAANLYRHFNDRKTLDEMEAEHPTGADWNAQFRFARRYEALPSSLPPSSFLSYPPPHRNTKRSYHPPPPTCPCTGILSRWLMLWTCRRRASTPERPPWTASMPWPSRSTSWPSRSACTATWLLCGASTGGLYPSKCHCEDEGGTDG
jgi:hypothetical protein